MKTVLNNLSFKITTFVLMMVAFQSSLLAQDVKAEIKGEEVGSWFSQNWLWVAGVVLLLVIILIASSGSRRSVTTTTTTPTTHVSRSTTTEVVED
ncbi:MAG: hypothetical protein V4539_12215 [Bacteroidota bacterium]